MISLFVLLAILVIAACAVALAFAFKNRRLWTFLLIAAAVALWILLMSAWLAWLSWS